MAQEPVSGDGDDPTGLFDRQFIARQLGQGRIVERNWLESAIWANLDDRECRIVLVTGDPGAGKSTLFAALADRNPSWLRYFIRRGGEIEDGWHRHEGGLGSFLTIVGMQLASVNPLLFPDMDESIALEIIEDVGRVAEFGRLIGIAIDEWTAHPFKRLTARVIQRVSTVEGEVVGAKIGRVIDLATQDPQALAEPALFGPAQHLAEQQPDERIVVLLDGVDELRFRSTGSGGMHLLQWLASVSELPKNVCFVISSRNDTPQVDELREVQARWLREILIDPDSEAVRDDTARYAGKIASDTSINGLLASHGITAERFVREVTRSADGNFQYLAFLARSLDIAAEQLSSPAPVSDSYQQADLEWLDSLQDLPSGLESLYQSFLARIRSRVSMDQRGAHLWESLYRPLLGMLAVAHAPLSVQQLDTFGNWLALDHRSLEALSAIRQFLDGDDVAGFRLYHASVGDFLIAPATEKRAPYLYCKPSNAHRRIVKYAFKTHRHDGSWKAADPYLRTYLPAHASAIRRLDVLLEDPRFLIAADPAGLLEHLGEAERAASVGQLYRQILSALRDGDEGSALAHLELYARQAGLSEFAARVQEVSARRPWTVDWTHWRPTPVRQVLGRHDEEVLVVTVAQVDRRPVAVSGGKDGLVRTWDLIAGESGSYFEHGYDAEHVYPVTTLATGELANGEAFVLSGGTDGVVRAWNLASRKPIRTPMVRLESAGAALAVGALNSVPCAVCVAGDRVAVWDLIAETPLGPPVSAENPEAAAVCAWQDRMLLAVGDNRGFQRELVRVWDIGTGEPVGKPLRPPESWVTSISIGTFNTLPIMAFCDGSHGVQAWDILSGEPLSSRLVDRQHAFTAVALGRLSNRPVMAVGNQSGKIRLWDFPTKEWTTYQQEASQFADVTALTFDDAVARQSLVAAGKDRRQHQERTSSYDPWDESALAPVIRELATDPKTPPIDPGSSVRSVAVATVNKRRVALATIGNRVQMWDQATAERLGSRLCGEREKVRAIAVGRLKGREVAVSGAGHYVRVWHITKKPEVQTSLPARIDILEDLGHVVALAVGQVRGRPVIVCGTWGAGVFLWDLETGKPAGAGHIDDPDYIQAMAIGKLQGRDVVIFGRSGLYVHDLETGEQLLAERPSLSRSQLTAVATAVHNDRTLIISGHIDRTIQVWDPSATLLGSESTTNNEADSRTAADDLRTLAATNLDGRLVAVCSGYSGAVRVVDLELEPAGAWAGSSTSSMALATVSGQPAVVCGGDDGVQVLDAGTGGQAAPLPSVRGGLRRITAVAAIEDNNGRAVGVCAVGNALHRWYLDNGEPAGIGTITHERVECVAA